jgi:hypothetical protein
MNTLEEVKAYFESKSYKVRLYDGVEEDEVAIAVMGKRSPPNSIGIFGFGSALIIVFSMQRWILRTIVGQRFKDEFYETIEGLLPAAESILGPPFEDTTAEREK